MESVIRDHVMKYFLVNDFFSNRQFGVLTGGSTVLQLLNIINDWNMSNSNSAGLSHLRADCLCTPGSAPGPTLGNEYGRTLPLVLHNSSDCTEVWRAFCATAEGLVLRISIAHAVIVLSSSNLRLVVAYKV